MGAFTKIVRDWDGEHKIELTISCIIKDVYDCDVEIAQGVSNYTIEEAEEKIEESKLIIEGLTAGIAKLKHFMYKSLVKKPVVNQVKKEKV